MVAMASIDCPALLVSAPASGQGKTLITAALARAWRNRGLKVRAFKCGPDFLDPMILQVATGQPVHNLDLGMCGEEDGRARLFAAAQDADVLIIEGVMGLYDGTPSTADIADLYGLPVLAVIDANAMAQTLGAIAYGLLHYRSTLLPAGVLANRVGSAGHAQMLRESLPSDLGWYGSLPADEIYAMPERHLGLFRADEISDLEQRIEAAADALANSGDLPVPPAVTFSLSSQQKIPPLLAGKTIAIARDEAFCFIYPANLDCLQALGAELTFFSPLHENALPKADAYWLPGGYPELHNKLIAENTGMRDMLQAAFDNQKPLLAECGGMMALSESIDGQPSFGLLPGTIQMQDRLLGLGTQHIALVQGKLSAHTFHYGRFDTSLKPASMAETRFGKPEALYRHGSVHASFLHFYFPSNPVAAASLFMP
jgi:cobyrinic acid a,c-diamide synthase